MAEDKTASAGTQAAQSTAVPTGGRTVAEFRDLAEGLRKRTDLFGKTLAAVATLGTTAVGLVKIGDLFPTDGNGWWAVLACLALAIAALAAIGVAVRLMKVARPIFMRADLGSIPDNELSFGEKTEVQPVFDEAAKRFGYSSLVGLEERERSLRNAALRATDKDERARRVALADEVKAEIEQALARGQVVVVRLRSTGAVSGLWAWPLYVAVAVGLILFAVGTDKVSSERKTEVHKAATAQAKNCGDARTAGAVLDELSRTGACTVPEKAGPKPLTVAEAKACGDARKAGAVSDELSRTGVCADDTESDAKEPKAPTAAEARLQIGAKLLDALDACTALAKQGEGKGGPLNENECEGVRTALTEMLKP
jgi:hypothetical protein